MANHEALIALSEEIRNSNAIKYEGRIETLGVNFYVFDRNYKELRIFLEVVKKQENILNLWDLRNQHKLDIAISEILRLLHNYLASAKSLIDQTRVVIRDWYRETNFTNEYKTQVNSRFVNNSLSGFIEDLRNFSLHYSLPITHAVLSVQITDPKTGKGEVNFSFKLIKSALLIWKGWTEKGKTFLSTSNDEIDIEALSEEYYKQILDFHSWLVQRLQEIHKDDLLWLVQTRQKTINLMRMKRKKIEGYYKKYFAKNTAQ